MNVLVGHLLCGRCVTGGKNVLLGHFTSLLHEIQIVHEANHFLKRFREELDLARYLSRSLKFKRWDCLLPLFCLGLLQRFLNGVKGLFVVKF